ncbi:phenylalanine--tRNA ligase subunit beta [Candidatus Kaiserbacteria bacterium]|nr:phenylalanine--tRNA ligase subunit beta [Candidatus Kaiserbacteria bacterium]
MKISRAWLQAFFDTPLPDADTLADALTFHVFEIDGIEQHGDDHILDVKVTANRGHDCLSYRGIAKEISAILNIPLKNHPLGDKLNLSPQTDAVSVSIDDPRCHRYIAGYIRDVKVAPSPQWLVSYLEKMGQKSINNVVDATNFVMFNIGAPLHAFDAGKLKTKNEKYQIDIRPAREGEKLLALDGKEYTLNPSILVISNDSTAIGVAGVKGGMPASITEDTKDIIIEAASFDGAAVRKAAQHMKLRTDASARFEQGMSPEWPAYAMRDMVLLIQQIAGGEIVGFTDAYPVKQEIKPVSVTLDHINKTLGMSITTDEVSDVFTRLGLLFVQEPVISQTYHHGDKSDLSPAPVFTVTPPFERLDLTIPEELIEEVGRHLGYDKVPSTPLPPSTALPEINHSFAAAERIREDLIAQGYSEVFTSVFAEKGERVVANKVDGVRPYLRTTLIDGLTEALKKNIPNKDLLGLKEIKLFEIGTVWPDAKEIQMVGTITEKGKASEKPLSEHTQNVGHPMSYINLPTSAAIRYAPYSRYPYIVRDIAFWTPSTLHHEANVGSVGSYISDVFKKESGELLQRVALFDTFTKADKTSLAFRLIFQSFEKTLTDEEVNLIMQKVSTVLSAKGFEIR